MANPKNPTWYGGGMSSDMAPGAGNLFYVNGIDGVGDDANSGLTRDVPLLTITAALALCVNDHDDYIVVLDYWQPTGETWPIDVNKSKVHIIGVPGAGAQWPAIVPTGDTAAFTVSAAHTEMAHLSINGGATHGCVESSITGKWGIMLRDCWFGVTGTGQDGFRGIGAVDIPYLMIHGCRFGVGLTRDGIRLEHNATRGQLGLPNGQGNFFDRIPGIGINLVGSCSEVGIYNNVIAVPANTAGGAITLSANCVNCIADGNKANFGDTTMGNVPFADGAAGGVNNWLMNYQGITAVMPT